MQGDEQGTRARLVQELFEGAKAPDWARSRLLKPGEVAAIFQVSGRAVNQWARSGKLPFVTTLGGQKRFPADRVAALLSAMGVEGGERVDVRQDVGESRSVSRDEASGKAGS